MARLRVDRFVPRAWRRSPLFAPLWPAAADFDALDAWPEVATYDAPGLPLRFVVQAKVRPGAGEPGYEAAIVLRREVATRPCNWHDFFNMLVWRSFPRAKWALAERQFAEATGASAATIGGNGRTRAQDRLAMLDEGGALVVAPIAEHPAIAGELRRVGPGLADPELGDAAVILFGHALYEHLVRGTGTVRGLAILVAAEAAPAGDLAAVDAGLAAALGRGEVIGDGERLGLPIRPPPASAGALGDRLRSP